MVAVVVVSIRPGSALADDVAPTNFESTVTRVAPRLEGVRFVVLGGDAYLSVSVDRGHEILVPGYFDEPYLRIDEDQSVYVNERSPAFYINSDRYGAVPIPSDAVASAEPVWKLVSRDGSYAWHDHRTHWMSEDLPPTVGGSETEQVFPWEIPVVVDGQSVTVSGELVWIPSHSPVPAIMAGVFVLLALVLWRRNRPWLPSAIVVAAGIAAAGVTAAQALATPALARSFPVIVLLPALAVVIGVVTLVRGPRDRRLGSVLAVVSALPLLVWTALSLDSLSLPVLVSGLPPVLERSLVAAIGWSVVAVVGIAVFEIIALREFPGGPGLVGSSQNRTIAGNVS